MPYKVTLPPGELLPAPQGVSPIPEKAGTPGTLRTPPDAKNRLWTLLDRWSWMDESVLTQEAVDRLKDEILDVFQAHPGEADTWYREWRTAHPAARLA